MKKIVPNFHVAKVAIVAFLLILLVELAQVHASKWLGPPTHKEMAQTWIGISEDETLYLRLFFKENGTGFGAYLNTKDETASPFRISKWKLREANINITISPMKNPFLGNAMKGTVNIYQATLINIRKNSKLKLYLFPEIPAKEFWYNLKSTMQNTEYYSDNEPFNNCLINDISQPSKCDEMAQMWFGIDPLGISDSHSGIDQFCRILLFPDGTGYGATIRTEYPYREYPVPFTIISWKVEDSRIIMTINKKAMMIHENLFYAPEGGYLEGEVSNNKLTFKSIACQWKTSSIKTYLLPENLVLQRWNKLKTAMENIKK